MDKNNLDKKIDKLINAMELLVDAVERGKGDNGYMSNSRFVRRIKDGGNDYLYKEFGELGQDDIEGIRNEIISNYQKGIKKANKKFNQLRKDLDKASTQSEKDEIRSKIKETERKKNELKRNKKNISNTDIEDYYNNYVREDSDYQLSKKWENLGKNEKKHYKDEQDFKNSEREKFKYHQTSNERDEVRRRIANSGLGDTAVGRYGQKMFDRQQRAADLGNFANYLGREGASKIGGMFGKGGLGKGVTDGLGKFAKGLGFASKLMGGPWVQAIMVAIDALKMVGEVVGEYKKFNADMINHQMQRENLQYENAKQTAILQNEGAIEDVKYTGDLQLKMMEIQSQNLIDAVKLTNEQYAASVQTAVGPMMQSINSAAYQAAENSISASAQIQRNLAAKETREQKAERYFQQRGLEYEGAKASLQAEQNIANVSYSTKSAENDLAQEQARSGNWKRSLISTFTSNNPSRLKSDLEYGNGQMTATSYKNIGGGTINPATGKPYVNTGRWENNGIGTDLINLGRDISMPGLGDAVKAEAMATLKATNQTLNQQADWDKTNIDNIYKLELEKKRIAVEVADTQRDAAQAIIDANIDTAEVIDKTWLHLAQHIEQFLDKVDVATNNTSLNMGYTNKAQMQSFQKILMQQARDVATQYGKKLEDVTNAQNAYIEATGRNKILGNHDYGQLFGLGKYLGDDNIAAQYGAEMEIFNHGIEDSVDMLDDVLKDVNKIGLNGRKYTKDLVNNLKLAQKYNFKGGTKELMEMAKWAQQTRFNIGSLGGMLDKVQEGGIEGVITQSAGFQVLGGHAAINSDPLGMLYDAWADPMAFGKRMQDMTKGFGRFNKETGETQFNINESMQIAQIAKLQGRSAEELRQEIMQRNKATQVEKQLNGYQGFNEEQKALISNKAEYKDGRWVVKMKGGSAKDVSQLSESDLEELMPTDHNERMEDYMKELIPLVEKMAGETERENLDQGLENIENYWNEYADRLKTAQESYEKNREEYQKKIEENMRLASSSFSNYMEIFKQGNDDVDDISGKIKQQAESIGDALAETAKIIYEANSRLGLDRRGDITSNPSSQHTSKVPTRHDPAAQYIDKPTTKSVNAKPLDTISSNKLKEWSKKPDGTSLYNFNPDTGIFNTPWGNYTNPIPAGDAITSGNGNSMFVSASNVTPVEDGTAHIARTNPNDTALFAKNGGPFDRLFNDVFGEINKVYNIVNNSSKVYSPFSMLNTSLFNDNRDGSLGGEKTSDYDHKIIKELFANGYFTKTLYDGYGNYDSESGVTKFSNSDKKELLRIANTEGRDIDDVMNEIARRNYIKASVGYNDINSINDTLPYDYNRGEQQGEYVPTNNSNGNVQVTINGKIELTGQNGQSVDIMEILRTNPMFVRQITEMVVLQMNNNTHGGRNELFHNRFSH